MGSFLLDPLLNNMDSLNPKAATQAAPAQNQPKRSLLSKVGHFLYSPRTLTTKTVGTDAQGNIVPVTAQAQIPTLLGGFIRPSMEAQQSMLNTAIQSAQAGALAKMEQMKMALEKAHVPVPTPYGIAVYDRLNNKFLPGLNWDELAKGNLQPTADNLFGPGGSMEDATPQERGEFAIRMSQIGSRPPDEKSRAGAAVFKDMYDRIAARRSKAENYPAIVQEYLFQVQEDIKAGKKPPSFDEYQTRDANRKASRTTIINQPDKILTPTEAAQLGVPYGTTRERAFGISPATEAQKITGNYANRVEQANDIINELEPDIVKMGLLGQTYQKIAPNFMQTNTGQVFDQAKRNFINSVLRRESGAVISASEFSEGEKQYFPVPGDNASVLKNKRRNRESVVQNFIQSAGNAYQAPGTLTKPSRSMQSEKVVDFKNLPQ